MADQPLTKERLQAVLDRLPNSPGVYLMKGSRNRLLYVGKAKNLRSRVRSYFRASGDTRPFVSRLGSVLVELEWVVTPTEKDALLLEREMIGRQRPRYNIDLKDDKNFLSIRLTAHADFPRLMVERHRLGPASEKAGRWFGPYTSAAAARQTLRVVQQLFGLRTCTDTVFARRDRPCLLHQMDRCLGPCSLPVDREEYAHRVQRATRFLRGQLGEFISELKVDMLRASEALQYEEAARLRDRLQAVQATLQRRQVVTNITTEVDVIGIYREGSNGVVQLIQVRGGRWTGSNRHAFSQVETPTGDLLRQFISQDYGPGSDVPAELILPQEAEGEQGLLADYLGELRSAQVRVISSPRGRKRQLLQAANDNAREGFGARLATTRTLVDRLERLQRKLGLSRLPSRIECFDMSTTGGRQSVGSMAVLVDGEVHKSSYRRYRIRSAPANSDVDMMREVVERRFRPVLQGEEPGPDLVVLDGGKGQLRTIETLFADLGLSDLDLVALAKGPAGAGRKKVARERVFVPGRRNPIQLRPDSDELFLLSRIRDEAHRFAISYHRKLRSRASLRSSLENIAGVGPVLRKRLLTRFGSLKGVRQAGHEQLREVAGVSRSLAERIQEHLSRDS